MRPGDESSPRSAATRQGWSAQMDGRAVLLARVLEAEADLDAVESMLRDTVFDGLPARDEVLARLRVPLQKQRHVLADARTAPAGQGWRHLESARYGSIGALQEALALLGGMLLRQNHIDGGAAVMADCLQRTLGDRVRRVTWPKASVPGVEERYHRVSELIRVRFPDTTVWSLPVIAHEVGHAVVAGYSEVALGGADNQLSFQVRYPQPTQREMVCDVFATLGVGPAYVSACLLLRFEPADADRSDGQHPPERERAHVMLRVLTQMGYQDTADRLRGAWQSALADAGTAPVTGQASAELDTQAVKMSVDLTTRLPDLPYTGMDRADTLAEQLERAVAPDLTLPTNMIDALNAAWLVRRRHWGVDGSLPSPVDRACLRLCRQVAGLPGDPP